MYQGLIWRIPDSWSAPPFAARPWLYPALYLRGRNLQATITQAAFLGDLSGARGLVLVVEDFMTTVEHKLLDAAKAAGIHRFVLPLEGLTSAELRAVEAAGAVVCPPKEDGPLSSAPLLSGPERRYVSVGPARLAEDHALAIELGFPGPASFGASRWAGRYLFVVAHDRESLLRIAHPVATAARGEGLQIVVTTAEPLLLEPLPTGFEKAVLVSDRDPQILALLAGARALVGGFDGARPQTLAPTVWVRTALHLGVPVVSASHPSLDGWAEFCVLDDLERGLQLYRDPTERSAAVARAAAFLSPRVSGDHLLKPWTKALKKPPGVALPPRRRPTLLALIDLSQDIDLLLPILTALRGRGAVNLEILVTDWLTEESPRTLEALDAAGLPFKLTPRGPLRKGVVPPLDGVDGVLSASETTAGPHRAGRYLAERANAAGLSSFTLQHGFENIGLTYRDETYGEEIGFESQTVFTWGKPEGLPDWVSAETRGKVRGVGNPKRTPLFAEAPELSSLMPGFGRYVGVFENLHWSRYTDAYRQQFIADLVATAAALPRTCFLVKPHQAGRWLVKNPDVLAETPNLKVLDPLSSEWRAFTAPALIARLDKVVTTPSTVALDAARAGRAVAVAGYGLDLQAYEPLPILGGPDDWMRMVTERDGRFVRRNESFIARTIIPGRADHRIAGVIEQTLAERSVEAVAASAQRR